MAIVRTQWKSYTATKVADSSGHRLHCSVSSFLTPYRHPTALDPRFRANWSASRLGLECLAPRPEHRMSDSLLQSLNPNWLTSFVFSSGLAGSRGNSSLCVFRAQIDKKILLDTLVLLQRYRRLFHQPPLTTHRDPPHTHPYIYIYIYMNIHIYQPLRTDRIWHKVIFKRSLTGLNSEFSFS